MVTVEAGSADGPPRLSNALPLALSPRVVSITPNPATRDANGDVTLTVQCRPQVQPEQHVRLLLGEREVVAAAHPNATDTLTFDIEDAPGGTFVVRLRIDSVDSLPLRQTPGRLTFEFDPAQQVTING
jgi:hypothetical protein